MMRMIVLGLTILIFYYLRGEDLKSYDIAYEIINENIFSVRSFICFLLVQNF